MRASTRSLIKKHGLRLDRTLHNYLYFTFYYPYVFSVYHTFRLMGKYLSGMKSLNPLLRAAFNRYHAKVLSFGDTQKIFTLDHDVVALTKQNREIIPFKYAYKILFQEADHIAVMDCPCKKTLGDRDWTINSCLAVGRGIAGFWIDHGKKYNARKISQDEALDLIKKFRKEGYLTQAFFKVATGGSTGVICNCHPDTCVSLRSSKIGRKFNPEFNMNSHAGYLVKQNTERCETCNSCAEICPAKAISIGKDGSWSLEGADCYGCELCVEHCPNQALSLYRDPSKPVPLDIDIIEDEYTDPE